MEREDLIEDNSYHLQYPGHYVGQQMVQGSVPIYTITEWALTMLPYCRVMSVHAHSLAHSRQLPLLPEIASKMLQRRGTAGIGQQISRAAVGDDVEEENYLLAHDIE